MAKQPSPGATRRAKAFLSRYTALAAEDYPDALAALARLLVREYRRGVDECIDGDLPLDCELWAAYRLGFTARDKLDTPPSKETLAALRRAGCMVGETASNAP